MSVVAPLVRRRGRGSDPPVPARADRVAVLTGVDAAGVHGEALHGCSLEIDPGFTVVAGTDRPGSASLLRVLAGVIRPTAGSVTVMGSPAADRRVRAEVGHCPEGFRGPPGASAFSLCQHLARLAGTPRADTADRADQALVAAGMLTDRDRPLRELSGGWRRRAMIAAALVDQPQVVLVEEPLAGLDAAGRVAIGQLLAELARDRLAVVASARADDGLRAVADRAVILRQGQVVAG